MQDQIIRIPKKYGPILNILGNESIGKIFKNIFGGKEELSDQEKIYFNLIMTDINNIQNQVKTGKENGPKGKEFGSLGGRPKKTQGGVILKTPQGAVLETPNIIEDNIIEDNINKNKETKKQINILSNFEIFWNLYPNKKSKPKAQEVFTKLIKSGVLYENIIQGLENYNKQIEILGTEKSFIKHPTTRLNQKCREDEYQTKTGKSLKDLPLLDQYKKILKLKEETGTAKDMIESELGINGDEYSEYYGGYKKRAREQRNKQQLILISKLRGSQVIN